VADGFRVAKQIDSVVETAAKALRFVMTTPDLEQFDEEST
jgi:hypothetical protein